MLRRAAIWVGLAAVGPIGAFAQGWTVQPAWVRAHEEFLASDALGGAGYVRRAMRRLRRRMWRASLRAMG